MVSLWERLDDFFLFLFFFLFSCKLCHTVERVGEYYIFAQYYIRRIFSKRNADANVLWLYVISCNSLVCWETATMRHKDTPHLHIGKSVPHMWSLELTYPVYLFIKIVALHWRIFKKKKKKVAHRENGRVFAPTSKCRTFERQFYF